MGKKVAKVNVRSSARTKSQPKTTVKSAKTIVKKTTKTPKTKAAPVKKIPIRKSAPKKTAPKAVPKKAAVPSGPKGYTPAEYIKFK